MTSDSEEAVLKHVSECGSSGKTVLALGRGGCLANKPVYQIIQSHSMTQLSKHNSGFLCQDGALEVPFKLQECAQVQ
jgi:hypothetical protein